MNKTEQIFQVVNSDTDTLVVWFASQEEADRFIAEQRKYFPNDPAMHVIPGTDYIYLKCRECGSVWVDERHDHYGISTGHWCDKCYDSPKYPYRKDGYFDPSFAGERLEDDY